MGILLALFLFIYILSIPEAEPIQNIRAVTVGGDFKCMDINGADIDCPLNPSIPQDLGNFSLK